MSYMARSKVVMREHLIQRGIQQRLIIKIGGMFTTSHEIVLLFFQNSVIRFFIIQ